MLLLPADPLRPRRPDEHFAAEARAAAAAGLAVALIDHDTLAGPGDAEQAVASAQLGPGPAVLRDYVKSMKHYWDEAAFIPDAADLAAVRKVAARFRELRGEDFTGGFVIRRFEELTSAEVRTWWAGGTCRLITAHPDTPGDQPPPGIDVTPFAPLISQLGLPFVTADLARRADGQWRIIELGDGQVSDRPSTTAPEALIAAVVAP
jgi:hypothetical protein